MHRQQLRRSFIEMALRRARRGTGSSATFLDRRTAVQPVPPIGAVLGDVAWLLIGGLATRAYMPERTTLDVDILIHPDDEAAARAAFVAAGYTLMGSLSIGGWTVERAGEPPIDVVLGTMPWIDDALAAPAHDAAGLPVLQRPYLMLMKLDAGRPQDLADVQRMLRDTPQAERHSTRALIARYLPDAAEDWDSLITLADLEFGTPPA